MKDSWKDWVVTLEADLDILTPERATEINSFWSESESRLADEDGDAVRAVIKSAARSFIYMFLEIGGAFISGVDQATYWTRDLHNLEGWGGTTKGSPYGWCGIRLISAEVDVDLDLEFEEGV
ncbi:TPA: DUF2528 family protein [Pseudomonas aeruginosa]|nr:DUF2528 family protein [Pseudomonas aeruginosa]HBO7181893.1 DUF2528 family protein [Pseudomonas aeruginosa]